MKRLLTLAMILIVLLSNTSIAIEQPPAPDAGAYILIDSKTGDVLCEKNPDTLVYPASTTKIMTAILALENGEMDKVMTASQAAIDDIGPDGSNIGIIAGEQVKLENLLQALLICSANESANIIAENLADSRQAFIGMMNEKAKELGAEKTHFANTNGMHDPNHYTTAADMAKFARYAMTFPEFRKIVSSNSLQMPPTNKHPEWPALANTNKLMISDKNDLYVINGIKTGFTGQAGFNLVSSAVDKNGLDLISVVMGVKGDGAQENVRTYSKELLDYGFNNFKKVDLLEKGKVYRNIKVENAADIYGLDLVTTDSLSCIVPKDAALQNIKEIPHISTNVAAPVNKDDIMGYIEFTRNDVSLGKVSLIAARSIEPKPAPVTLASKVKDFLHNIFVRIGLYSAGAIVFFLLLRMTLRRISRKVHSRRYS
ncbi:MAG TPA: D-alanyl-D-alanine carboxypeptidase family protein [Clostridia bacterium]|nr:D-alanyl-D-alanine carboxypeptidase family protein [Clostridia bacterium]